MCLLAPVIAAAVYGDDRGTGQSLVLNGGFDLGRLGWTLRADARIEPAGEGGRGLILRMKGRGSAVQDVILPARKPESLTVAVDASARKIEAEGESGYAYAAVYMYSPEGTLLAVRDFVQLRKPQPWKRYHWTFRPPPECTVVSLRCGIFNAVGEAAFDGWTLVAGGQPAPFRSGSERRPFTGVPGGVVGVFREAGFPGSRGAVDPETIASLLRPAVGRVEFLNADRLSDPGVLRPDRFDLIVLPYGENFPAAARDAFVAYLHTGGDFLSFGGYAFSRLLRRDAAGRWRPENEIARERIRRALRPDRSLVADGGFEHSAGRKSGSWRSYGPGCRIVTESPYEGRFCARVRIPPEQAESGARWETVLPVRPGRTIRVRTACRTTAISGQGFAYAAVYQFGDDERLLAFHDFVQCRKKLPWRVATYDFTVVPGARRVALRLGMFRAAGTVWFDDVRAADITGLRTPPLNTRTGKPEDGLRTRPDQIGVFDADFRLERVSRVIAPPDVPVFPGTVRLGAVRGWAASAVLGSNEARWTPLLDARDRYGRPRGAAAALVRRYAGFYSASAWGIFGVTDRNLLAAPQEDFVEGVRRLVRTMVRGVFLHSMAPEKTSLHPGEAVRVRVVAENHGAQARKCRLRWRVLDRKGRIVMKREETLQIMPFRPIEASFVVRTSQAMGEGMLTVAARLETSPEGAWCDTARAAVLVFDSPARRGLTPLRFRDNYFHLGDRAIFIFGTDAYANDYTGAEAGPLRWATLHRACRDFGFLLYENLQYSRPDHRMQSADWDRFRGMARSTQDSGLIFMPGMLIGHNVAVGLEEVRAESAQCREYARRLKDVPRLLWYVNGDYKLRYDDKAALRARWNDFLKRRYGTEAALRKAWGRAVSPGLRFGDFPFPAQTGGRWDDPVALDRSRFNIELLCSWNEAHVRAVREFDPVHPITSEYYSTPFNGIDLRWTIDGLNVSNIGFFAEPGEDLRLLPLRLRWNDLRARGRSAGLGEYGVKTHPAWSPANGGRGYHITRTRTEEDDLFISVALGVFGMGGSRVQNWCLQDAPERVFPWGVLYPCPAIPKQVAYTHRNLSLLLRAFAPRYVAPSLTVLFCANMRLGNRARLGYESQVRAVQTLLALDVPFNVLDDTHTDEIPGSTKVLIWPAALCPSDQAVRDVEAWVRQGGALLLTGDFAFDADRRPSRAGRFPRIAGVKRIRNLYLPGSRAKAPSVPAERTAGGLDIAKVRPQVEIEPEAGTTVVVRTAGGRAVIVERRLGRGRVVYCADPFEIGSSREDARSAAALYTWFLEKTGEMRNRVPVTPRAHDLFAFRQAVRTGSVFVVYDHADGVVREAVVTPSELKDRGLRFRVRLGRPAMAAVDKQGNVTAVAGLGRVCEVRSDVDGEQDLLRVDDAPDANAAYAAAVTLDGRDLRRSEAVLILPFSSGRLQVAAGNAGEGEERVLLLGDVHDGKFRVFETLAVGRAGPVRVDLNADRATLIGLCVPRRKMQYWQDQLTRYIRDPESFPGM